VRLALLDSEPAGVLAYDAQGTVWELLALLPEGPRWHRTHYIVTPEFEAELDAGLRDELLFRADDPTLSTSEVLAGSWSSL
jgi:hypothetical protein